MNNIMTLDEYTESQMMSPSGLWILSYDFKKDDDEVTESNSNGESDEVSGFRKMLESVGIYAECAKLSNSVYTFKSDATLFELYDKIRLLFTSKDFYFLSPLIKPFNGKCPPKTEVFLDEHYPDEEE